VAGGFEARLPHVGPWLGDVQPAAGGLGLRIGLRIDEPGRSAPLQGVATLLCDAQRRPLGPVIRHACGPDRHEQVLEVLLPRPLPGDTDTDTDTDTDADAPARGPLRLLVAAVHGAWPDSAQAQVQAVDARCAHLQRSADAQLTPLAATEGLLLDRGWLQRIARPRADRLGLALGACRQRPLLTDRPLADAAMGVLLAALDGPAPAAHAPIDLVLLAGDQVYADTRVDSGHTGAQRRQYFEAHHEAWSAPHQREVLRRRPVVMALDDHEFRNDYNNRIAAGRPQEVHAAATAWQRYQLAAGPRQPEVHPALPGAELKAAWRAFRQCGFAVFVCDTRSERADTSRVDRRGAKLMSDLQMAALQDWLLTLQHDPAYGDRPKVVVTGGLYSPYPFANATRGEWLDGAEARGLRAGDTTWGYTITASTPGSGWTRLTLGADGQVQADFVAVLPPAT